MHVPQFMDVRGVRTRYLSAGSGDPVVLVHGGHIGDRSSATDWELNIDDLARTHTVYAIDKLGMGLTDNPEVDEDYLIDGPVRHLAGFFEVLGLDRVHLVGHSRGGYVATRLALDHPELLQSLTVVSSSSVTNPLNPVYAEWKRNASTMEERDAVRYLISANSYADDHITESLVDIGVEIGRLEKTQAAQATMARLADRFRSDFLERLAVLKSEIASGGLTMPTLLFWGFNDPSATIERCGKPAIDQFFGAVDRCEMHIVNHAGHFCYREQPAAFAETFLGFIGRHCSADAGGAGR
jgi:2-hydroxy-6-oxonona-2,4-dienedioate hydrolase